MNVTLDLQPEVEKQLLAQTAARGISPGDYVKEIVVREAGLSTEDGRRTGQELIDACANVRGLLTDEEVDTLLSRTPSFSRPVSFE